MLHRIRNLYTTELSAPSISYILKKISDDKALALFNNIALAKDNSHIPLKEMNLSTKQYYSRISGLTSAGPDKEEKRSVLSNCFGKGSLQCPHSNW